MTSLWTREQVQKFLDDHPIDTQGAFNQHQRKVSEVDDGDVYLMVEAELWSQNDSVVKCVLRLALDAATAGAKVYARDGVIRMDFYVSVCDPD